MAPPEIAVVFTKLRITETARLLFVEGVKKDYDDGRLNLVHVLSTDQDRNSMYLSVNLRTWSLETS